MRGTIPLIIALSASADAYAAMGLSRSAPVIRHRAPPSFAPAPTPLRTPQSAATMMALNAPPALTSAVKTSLSLGGIVGVDAVLRRVFAANSIPFPSALAGMLGLFSVLCTLQATAPRAASKIASAAQPGCDFISRWLALFFVPNLVVLPLVLQMSAAEFGKLLAVIVLGLGASLPLAALTATAMLDVTKEAGPTAEAAASAQWKSGGAAEWKAPVKQYLLDPPLLVLSGASAVCMGLSLAGIGRAAAFNVHLLMATVCGFVAGGRVPKQYQKVLHPLISCTLLTQLTIGAYALLSAQPLKATLRTYLLPGAPALAAPGNLLLYMLGPATLSFGFQMFSRRKLMRQSAKAVSAVTTVAASFGLFATAIAGRLLQMDIPVRLAALPRQVTAPLAIAIAGILKADPSLAATIVVVTGLLCANFGRAALDALGVTSPVARGLAMGASGHGLGTAAMAEEKEAFPFAAIAMALNAALSTVLVSVPAVRKLLLRAAGVP
jgi:putative effector of murein hydrolase/putative effector of murein hydrolase LrgA (UPF0299 family)